MNQRMTRSAPSGSKPYLMTEGPITFTGSDGQRKEYDDGTGMLKVCFYILLNAVALWVGQASIM